MLAAVSKKGNRGRRVLLVGSSPVDVGGFIWGGRESSVGWLRLFRLVVPRKMKGKDVSSEKEFDLVSQSQAFSGLTDYSKLSHHLRLQKKGRTKAHNTLA